MRQPILGSGRINPTPATVWCGISGVPGGDWTDTEANAICPVPVAGTLRKLRVKVVTAPGGSTAHVFAIRVNGVDTALTCTISGSGTSASDLVNSVSLSAGDTLTLQRDATGGTPADTIAMWALEFVSAVANESLHCAWSNSLLAVGQDVWVHPFGPFGATGSGERSRAAVPGALTRYDALVTTAPGAGNSHDFTLYKNGVAQDGSGGTPDTRFSISDANTSGTLSGFSLTVAAGDLIQVRSEETGGAATTSPKFGFKFVADTDGYSNVGFASSGLMGNAATSWTTYGWPSSFSTTEAARTHIISGEFWFWGMQCMITSAPGTGNTWVVSLRQNGADAAPTPTITRSGLTADVLEADIDPTHATHYSDGDTLSVQSVPDSGPNDSTMHLMLIASDHDPNATDPNPDPGVSLCGAETVYVWMELQTDDGVEFYAKDNLALGSPFLEGRVLNFGTVRRGFSRERGGYETATASIELIDTDRVLRGLAATNTLINKRCDIYISTDEAMRAGDIPRRVMQGIVRRYKPLPQLKFRLDLEDFFGSSFSHFSGDREIPTRTFSTDDFPNLENAADDSVSPGNPTLAGKSVPIAYGHLSDAGSGSKGVVPCHYVGRRNVNSYDWDEYVVCGHAIKEIEEWYAAASVDAYDLPRELMPTSTEGVDFLIPGFAGWATHVGTSDMYRDFNGNRYTVIYARGPRSDAAREGKVPFTLNIKAAETVGDGTGDLIESLPEQIEHLICNWILQSYESGDWPDIPTIGTPPYEQFRSTSTDVVKAASIARLSGSPLTDGYLGAFMLGWQGQFHQVSEIVGDACRSCDIDIGLNKDGQLFMSMVDVDAASTKDWSDVTDVIKDTFDIDHDVDRLANRIEYRYQRRYVDEPTQLVDLIVGSPAAESVRLPPENREPQTDWLIDNQAQEDTASILAIGEARIFDLSLTYVRDLDTASDVVAQLLARLKTGPVHATFGVDLCGTDVENGDNCTIDEYQGLSLTGWTDRLIRIEEHELNLDTFMVTLVARDLE